MFRKLFSSAGSDKTRTFGDVSVILEGRRWKGGYSVETGKLHVSSAWGSRSEAVGRSSGELSDRATTILGEIIAARDPEV